MSIDMKQSDLLILLEGETMYEILSQISGWLSQPFTSAAYSTEFALLAALMLGVVGSVAPCQISANLGAISFFGNRYVQKMVSSWEIVLYLGGKVLVFSIFGLLFWLFDEGISNQSIPIFAVARKMLGPLFILIGLYLLNWIKLPGGIGYRISRQMEVWAQRIGGKWGSFLMGVAFSLGFCPTMFWLFFGVLMPMTFESSTGPLLPSIFAIGTAIPLLVVFGLYIGFGLERIMVKKLRKWGSHIQKVTGLFFVLWGMMDSFTYWTL